MITAKLDLGKELMDQLSTKTVFTIPHTNITFDEGTVVSWVIMAAITILSIILVRDLKVEGDISRRQLILETCVGKMRDFFHSIMGENGDRYIPWMMTVAVYIGACNMVGLFGLKAPTKELNVTAAMAIMSILLVQYANIRQRGVGGWLKSFAKPVAIVAPINVLELAIKPLSLCMRLFGNILGAFIIMELLKAVIPLVVPLALSMYFDIFDGFIQAYVFVFLTSLYVNEAVE